LAALRGYRHQSICGDAFMRARLAIAAILTLGLTTGLAAADPYRWCAEGVNGCGSSSCYFKTLEQCRAAAAGNGGHCMLNPFYTGPDEPGAPRLSKRRN
jgi:hypothetical protein